MSIADSLPPSLQPVIAWLAGPAHGGAARAPLAGLQLDHAILAFAGGAVILPWVLLVTRYFKVRRHQDWPRELDDPLWRRVHLWGSSLTMVMIVVACVVAFSQRDGGVHLNSLHDYAGGLALLMLVVVMLHTPMRGSRGGPTRAQLRTLGPYHGVAGDHYDMTERRQRFELLHRWGGLVTLLAVLGAELSGIWMHGPSWLLLATLAWWLLLAALAWRFERQGRSIDTYQAIWGPGLEHPGNRIPTVGWGHRRYDEPDFQALPWVRIRVRGRGTGGASSARSPAAAEPDAIGPDTAATMALNESPETIFMTDDDVPFVPPARPAPASSGLPSSAPPSSGRRPVPPSRG